LILAAVEVLRESGAGHRDDRDTIAQSVLSHRRLLALTFGPGGCRDGRRGPVHRPGLPDVIADSADGGTAAEGRNYLVTDGQRLTDVGELALQAAAVLDGYDRADQRRAQREREPVDGDGDDASCLSGGGHGLELAGGAALEADP